MKENDNKINYYWIECVEIKMVNEMNIEYILFFCWCCSGINIRKDHRLLTKYMANFLRSQLANCNVSFGGRPKPRLFSIIFISAAVGSCCNWVCCICWFVRCCVCCIYDDCVGCCVIAKNLSNGDLYIRHIYTHSHCVKAWQRNNYSYPIQYSQLKHFELS